MTVACAGFDSYDTITSASSSFFFFFFNDTATTEIYTLSLHDALPISWRTHEHRAGPPPLADLASDGLDARSEEHTSELQSPCNLVCRLLLEKKKKYRQCMRLTQLPLHRRRLLCMSSNSPYLHIAFCLT